MTVLVASPQNVRSCTHILPITKDRLFLTYVLPSAHFVVLFVIVMHFLSRLSIVRSSHLCHLLIIPPTNRPGITHAIVQ